MRKPRPVPAPLIGRPFHRDQALELGVTARMLEHPRFVELLPRVYRHVDTLMTPRHWVTAGSLTLPGDAHLSHHSRFVRLGLDHGSLFPLHFTVGRDHHIAHEKLFLHRTLRLPHRSADGLSIAASVVGMASVRRLIDVVSAADWLLHRDHLRVAALEHILLEEGWRPGTRSTADALPLLEARSRSLPESEIRAMLCCAGLPRPLSNADLVVDDELLGCGDLVYRLLRLVIEYEGRQHALDPAQFQRDIHRYRGFREADIAYVQITREMLRRPRTVVMTIHRAMVNRGYDGPPPSFGPRWHRLFETPEPLRHLPRAWGSSRRHRLSVAARGR